MTLSVMNPQLHFYLLEFCLVIKVFGLGQLLTIGTILHEGVLGEYTPPPASLNDPHACTGFLLAQAYKAKRLSFFLILLFSIFS